MALVEYTLKDGIAYLTLNRPEKLNALSDDLALELRAALFRLNDDKNAQIGILSGSGRAFCSGADVKQRQMRPREEMEKFGGPAIRDAKLEFPFFRSSKSKPIIAAVHGYAVGAGLKIALYCDIIVASKDAKFQITETTRGLNGSRMWMLLTQRGVGALASEVALTGRMWSGEEAMAGGMINRLAEPGEHLQVAEALAKEIIQNPPLAVRAVIEARRGTVEEVEVRAHLLRPRNLHLSDDFRESAKAFVEKRVPAGFHSK